ncbi:tRNA (guanine(37)-N1)-methyltransferase [Gracilariopsis chorda]|uniref:tRNA (guanine(37)-N1)-methyltransferase n=1 Tax=Gracilariopsis chorda TaxID=448386 RepID=A0A2V3INY0_9FLOR|nr:tRNA (guanine(37)-N1)-methyltransferase [Gracilariopsis chorda]|eukprot:PXF43759.1 tRNA (guanine(37)-N1)-methyltransferase [Gracilariopsis chorda]
MVPAVDNTTPAEKTAAALDRASFSEKWSVYALRVPAKLCHGTRKAIKNHTLNLNRILSVVKLSQDDNHDAAVPTILLLLKYFSEHPHFKHANSPRGNTDESLIDATKEKVAKTLRESKLPEKIPSPVQSFLKQVKPDDVFTKQVQVDYANWSAESVLKEIMPDNVTIPSSFESIGHIAHLNLRDEQAPFKQLIGQVMLDKLGPRVKTIVNKLENTGGPYRTFAMEVLAGEDNLITSVKENGCTFKMDFSKVYWNSRLETEHRKIINSLKEDDVLADAFCGIGPFTIPAAKQKKCKAVYANDLNPSSVVYLRENVKINKLDERSIHTSCSCSRTFLTRLVKKEQVPITRVLMNFPAGAPEFLDVFRGLYADWCGERPPMPIIHCYCFVRDEEDMGSARKRARVALCGDREDADILLPDACIDVRDVRDVAPRKRQVCVTVRVPEEIAFHNQEQEEPLQKKARAG